MNKKEMNKKAFWGSIIIFLLATCSYFYYNYNEDQRSKEFITGHFEYRFEFFDNNENDANMLVDSYQFNLYEKDTYLSLNIREYPERNIKDKTVRIHYYLYTDKNRDKKELNGPNLNSSYLDKVTITRYVPGLSEKEIEIDRKYFEKNMGSFYLDLNFSRIDLIDKNDNDILINIYFKDIKFKKYDYYLNYNINDEYSNTFVFRYDDHVFEDAIITYDYTDNVLMLKCNQPLIYLKLKRDEKIPILFASISVGSIILALITRFWEYFKEKSPGKNQSNTKASKTPVDLYIRRIRWEEVRRGWVRIHETKRNEIKKGTLIKLSYNNKSVRRIVLGIPDDYPDNDHKKGIENYIYMDEDTREFLELKEYTSGETYKFIIKKDYWGIGSILFYFNHPDL